MMNMPRLKSENDLHEMSPPADAFVPKATQGAGEAAREIINREKAARDAKTARLKALRLAREAADPPATAKGKR
jgi:hypothetical protein